MARMYADENFDYPVVQELRLLGHDVLTAQEAGQAQQRVPDSGVLAFATAQGRAVLTFNRRDFIRLHGRSSAHSGIIVCTRPKLTASSDQGVGCKNVCACSCSAGCGVQELVGAGNMFPRDE